MSTPGLKSTVVTYGGKTTKKQRLTVQKLIDLFLLKDKGRKKKLITLFFVKYANLYQVLVHVKHGVLI